MKSDLWLTFVKLFRESESIFSKFENFLLRFGCWALGCAVLEIHGY
jgi:hypothetical protein